LSELLKELTHIAMVEGTAATRGFGRMRVGEWSWMYMCSSQGSPHSVRSMMHSDLRSKGHCRITSQSLVCRGNHAVVGKG
jgi:hypothetical protein